MVYIYLPESLISMVNLPGYFESSFSFLNGIKAHESHDVPFEILGFPFRKKHDMHIFSPPFFAGYPGLQISDFQCFKSSFFGAG